MLTPRSRPTHVSSGLATPWQCNVRSRTKSTKLLVAEKGPLKFAAKWPVRACANRPVWSVASSAAGIGTARTSASRIGRPDPEIWPQQYANGGARPLAPSCARTSLFSRSCRQYGVDVNLSLLGLWKFNFPATTRGGALLEARPTSGL
jgi:hypothetical protein